MKNSIPKFWRKASSLKTVDINCYKWRDKINGNTYFACAVTINHCLKNEYQFNIRIQYGYGDHYLDVTAKKLIDLGITDKNIYRWSDRENVIVRTNTYDNCKKSQLTALKGEY